MKRVLLIPVVILLIAMLVLGACSSKTSTTPAATTSSPSATTSKPAATTIQPKLGGTLILSRFSNDGVNLGDPSKHAGMNSWYHSSPALETLLRADASGALIPWLATAWKEDVTTKSITMTIRQGVKFHDGSVLDAEAVRWNLQHQIDNKYAAVARYASVEVVDANNIRINLKTWDSTVLGSLAGDSGMMISPTAFQKNGADWAAANPVGTGPFVLNKWDKGSLVLYDKNPNYWIKGQPYLDHIQWSVIPDMSSKALTFQNGELDVVMTMDAPQITTLNAAGFTTLHQVIGSGADGFTFSSGNASSPWAKLAVRQAACYAVNNTEYTTAIYGAEAAPANQLVGKNSWAYNPNVAGYPYNPDKAKQLLTDAGYPNGFSSVIFGATDQTTNNRVLAIQGYLKKVGITLDIQVLQGTQATEMTQQGKGWEGLISSSLGTSTDVVDTLSRYYSGVNNMMFVSMIVPADYKQAIQDAISAPDFATKQKLTQGLMKTFTDTYCLQLITDTRFDNAFEQKWVHDSGILKSVNTQMWTPEIAWISK